MEATYTNLCVRCGKQRVIIKSWEEKLGFSTVMATMTACPDKECQKIVDASNKKQQAKQEALRKKSNQRLKARRKSTKK